MINLLIEREKLTMQADLRKLRYFALDMDGTIYLGQTLLPGARKFLDYLVCSDRKYIFLTNNSSGNRQSYVDRLRKLGIEARTDQILTSGEATALYLNGIKPGARLYLSGTPELAREFIDYGFSLTDSEPDFVVLGFDQTLTYARLVELCHLVREGVPFIATHPDINCPVDIRSGYIPDVGSMLAMIHASTGRRARSIGKPNKEMAEALMSRLGGAREETAMVGDRLYTDIQMAVNAGLCGILVLSGETRQADLAGAVVQPDYVFAGVRELTTALHQVDQSAGRVLR